MLRPFSWHFHLTCHVLLFTYSNIILKAKSLSLNFLQSATQKVYLRAIKSPKLGPLTTARVTICPCVCGCMCPLRTSVFMLALLWGSTEWDRCITPHWNQYTINRITLHHPGLSICTCHSLTWLQTLVWNTSLTNTGAVTDSWTYNSFMV